MLDDIISISLAAFAADITTGVWNGRREREAVSLYSFGYLVPHVDPAGWIKDPSQISIEVPVPQVADCSATTRQKDQVCKDIVLWPKPQMTCWDPDGLPTVPPAAIMEWKFNESRVSARDVDWLVRFSREFDAFVGYAVCIDQAQRNFLLSCTRVECGRVSEKWLLLENAG